MIILIANSANQLTARFGNVTKTYICAIGRSGMIDGPDKREGDGASPVGMWRMRRIFYRADRAARPETGLPCTIITKQMGWCDDAGHSAYNQLVALPFTASHETLWRDDQAYDVIVELGHNDRPVVPGLGSAVFIHVAKPGYRPTEGCIALALDDLLSVLRNSTPETQLEITF